MLTEQQSARRRHPPTRTPRASWIEAGLRALAARGPDAVRVEVLAKSLGVTRGGFYGLFTSRGELQDAMLDTSERPIVFLASAEVREALVTPELGDVESFDGERISLFVFRPSSTQRRPAVVVAVHGGPEARSDDAAVRSRRPGTGGRRPRGRGPRRPWLDGLRPALRLARRQDEAGRAALWGGSYGGYMTLAGLAFQPDLWAAGVDIVGISNLVTFLEHTSDYRRAHRELGYGSLTDDRQFLISASPLTHVVAIRSPLFVIHGRDDPRVPPREARQLVASLEQRGIRCELRIYDDEGHGLARLANQLDAYPSAIAFLDEVLAR